MGIPSVAPSSSFHNLLIYTVWKAVCLSVIKKSGKTDGEVYGFA